MIKRESKASILFRHWLLVNAHLFDSCTFEIKQTETDSIPFSALKEHQENFSLAIKHGNKGVLIRNEAGTIGAPDYSFYKHAPAYIVIKYPQMFCVIDIDKLILQRDTQERKSLTSALAAKIATHVVKI